MGYRDLAALAAEARKKGMTYGQLVAETTPQQQAKIVKEYWKKQEQEKKAEKGK